MGMELRMEQRMIMECSACGRSMTEHAHDCPQGMIELIWNAVKRGNCPACRKSDVIPNRADYYECRRCHVQYSVGMVCAGEDPDTLQTRFLDLLGETDLVQVKQMKALGTGDFPVLEKLETLRAYVTAARAGRRATKREQARVLKRELAKIQKRKEGGTR